ncbi:hypothetical protein OEZ86_005801 [Tetradesmus obliquus]|nr:hypothetical protein OEZ86_005801 [Tetradesmus obliquus]
MQRSSGNRQEGPCPFLPTTCAATRDTAGDTRAEHRLCGARQEVHRATAAGSSASAGAREPRAAAGSNAQSRLEDKRHVWSNLGSDAPTA